MGVKRYLYIRLIVKIERNERIASITYSIKGIMADIIF